MMAKALAQFLRYWGFPALGASSCGALVEAVNGVTSWRADLAALLGWVFCVAVIEVSARQKA